MTRDRTKTEILDSGKKRERTEKMTSSHLLALLLLLLLFRPTSKVRSAQKMEEMPRVCRLCNRSAERASWPTVNTFKAQNDRKQHKKVQQKIFLLKQENILSNKYIIQTMSLLINIIHNSAIFYPNNT